MQVAKICKDKGAPQTETYSVDLTDIQALDAFAKAFLKDHKHCDVLVNNAGVMVAGSPTEGDAQCAAVCCVSRHPIVALMTHQQDWMQVTSMSGSSVYS